jgi:hypothetical protein
VRRYVRQLQKRPAPMRIQVLIQAALTVDLPITEITG